jgi:hypothetical protein
VTRDEHPESLTGSDQPEHRRPSGSTVGLFVIRYGIGGVIVVAGVVLLLAVPGTGVDGFAMAVGGGLAVLMLNGLFRLGVSGDEERRREEDARRYLDEHGEWPEDPPPKRREWTLPPGVVMPEHDQEPDER